jgi:hypothetical protein
VGTGAFATDILLLLMLDEERGVFRGGARLAHGLSAALLSDTVRLGRVRIRGGRVEVLARRRTGHFLLDEHVARLPDDPTRASACIAQWSEEDLSFHLAERLVIAGTLALRTYRMFGLFAERRYVIVPPRARIALRAAVRGVLAEPEEVSPPEIVATAAILAALGEDHLLHADAFRDGAEALVRADPVASALREATQSRVFARRASFARVG